jgi:hypothetical protein
VHMLRPIAGGERGEAYARMITGSLRALVIWRVERGESIADDAELIADTFVRGIEPL